MQDKTDELIAAIISVAKAGARITMPVDQAMFKKLVETGLDVGEHPDGVIIQTEESMAQQVRDQGFMP